MDPPFIEQDEMVQEEEDQEEILQPAARAGPDYDAFVNRGGF